MAGFSITVVPVGRIDVEEVEAAVLRAARVWHEPMELRRALPVPHVSEDNERRQHRAATLIATLRDEVLKLRPGKLVGTSEEGQAPPPRPDGFIFLTDVDLFTANSDSVFAALMRQRQGAVVSVRRLREAYYRRPADPNRQRARVVKEILRMAGRLRGLSECADPQCVLGPSKVLPDLDTKEERFCRACEQRMFEGRVQI